MKKLLSLISVVVLSVAFVGCDAGTMADKAKSGVDSTAGAANEAAGAVVPEEAKAHVEGAVEGGSDAAKDAIDSAAGSNESAPGLVDRSEARIVLGAI